MHQKPLKLFILKLLYFKKKNKQKFNDLKHKKNISYHRFLIYISCLTIK